MPLHYWPQFLLLKLSRNEVPFFSPSAKPWTSKDIPSYGSWSKGAQIAIHWFGKHQWLLVILWRLSHRFLLYFCINQLCTSSQINVIILYLWSLRWFIFCFSFCFFSWKGPCLEYLLQYKILDTLHTLGRADVGICFTTITVSKK